MRQIVLDTETTGLSAENGDRIIEIGCVELVGRKLTGNNKHFYLNPERDSHEDALKVHGISNEFLKDKPKFAAVAGELNARFASSYQIRSAKTLPTPIGPDSPATALGTDPYGRSAAVNGGLVKAARFHNPTVSQPALKFAQDLARPVVGLTRGGMLYLHRR